MKLTVVGAGYRVSNLAGVFQQSGVLVRIWKTRGAGLGVNL
jgi:hypothetical protein